MLLKHNRKQPTFQEGGNASTVQRTAMQVRQQQVIGQYITKEKRIEQKNEIQRAHFHMGFDKKSMPKQSYGQELIDQSAGHINEQTILNNASDMATRKENARKSNFDVGHIAAKSNNDKYAVDTASREAFRPEFLAMHQKAEKVQKDFRGGKLYMGSSGNEYTTTNKDNFSDQLLQDRLQSMNPNDAHTEKQQRVLKNRMQQFTYGHEMPNYQSITKKDFQEYGSASMANNISKISSQKVRETHFQFGNDQFIHQIGTGPQLNNWSPGKEKQKEKLDQSDKKQKKNSSALSKDVKSLNQKSNFNIGKDQLVQNQFYSMQKQAMDSVKNKPFDTSNQSDIKNEVQKTHFNLGSSKLDYVSYTVGTMVEHQITKEQVYETDKNRKQAVEQMRNANFKIPNQHVLKTGVSTYKQNISDLTTENQLAGQSAQLLTNLKQSSVKIGGKDGKLASSTEQADQFVNPNYGSTRGDDVKNNAQMKDYLKGHHFELGNKRLRQSAQASGPHSVISQAQTPSVNHYQNYRQSVEDTGKFQKEQRAHHFQMGYELRPTTAKSNENFTLQKHLSTQIQTGASTIQAGRGVSSQMSGVGHYSNRLVPSLEGNSKQRFANSKPTGGDGSQARKLQEMVDKNRGTNIVYGQGVANTGQGQGTKTMNQAYYKWIQPVK